MVAATVMTVCTENQPYYRITQTDKIGDMLHLNPTSHTGADMTIKGLMDGTKVRISLICDPPSAGMYKDAKEAHL